MDTNINSLAMWLPMLFGMNMSQWARQHNKAPSNAIPGSVNTGVMSAQDTIGKSLIKRKGRQASNVTGGLLGMGTLGGGALWGSQA